jgi:hypothetical protein
MKLSGSLFTARAICASVNLAIRLRLLLSVFCREARVVCFPLMTSCFPGADQSPRGSTPRVDDKEDFTIGDAVGTYPVFAVAPSNIGAFESRTIENQLGELKIHAMLG